MSRQLCRRAKRRQWRRLPPAGQGPLAHRCADRLTELLRIVAHASAYDIPVIPHGSGPYSYHFIDSQTAVPLCEYVAASADGRSIRPAFGDLFVGEALPDQGRLRVPDAPGFGMTIADRSMLQRFE